MIDDEDARIHAIRVIPVDGGDPGIDPDLTKPDGSPVGHSVWTEAKPPLWHMEVTFEWRGNAPPPEIAALLKRAEDGR